MFIITKLKKDEFFLERPKGLMRQYISKEVAKFKSKIKISGNYRVSLSKRTILGDYFYTFHEESSGPFLTKDEVRSALEKMDPGL